MPNGTHYYDSPPPSEPIKSVWLAWWNNGIDYDSEIQLIGVYTSKKKAKRDARLYRDIRKKSGDYKRAFTWCEEVSTDKPIAHIANIDGTIIIPDEKE